jgi:lysophospholipase L1-like esterase
MKHLIPGLLLLVATACAPLPNPAHLQLPPGARYVAMGSSFASGPLLGPPKPGSPARCARTAANYPTLLAARLGLALVDVSCGGAATPHILGAWNELPAQIDSVTADTDLVTLSIGGNDLGYVSGLIAASCRAGAPYRSGLNTSGPCQQARVLTQEDYTRAEHNLKEIVRQVTIRAPHAKLVLVQAVTLVPPMPCEAVTLSPLDALASKAIGLRLAVITAKVARDSGAMILRSDLMSRQHTACSTDPWSNGMSPGYDGAKGAPWHPTAAGMKAIADALAARLSGDLSNRAQ